MLCSCENCIPNLVAVSSLYICENPTLRENKSLKPEIALQLKAFGTVHTMDWTREIGKYTHTQIQIHTYTNTNTVHTQKNIKQNNKIKTLKKDQTKSSQT